jgi:hypothetical protein
MRCGRYGAVLSCAAMLSGCVVGQQLRLDSTPDAMETVGAGKPVTWANTGPASATRGT